MSCDILLATIVVYANFIFPQNLYSIVPSEIHYLEKLAYFSFFCLDLSVARDDELTNSGVVITGHTWNGQQQCNFSTSFEQASAGKGGL